MALNKVTYTDDVTVIEAQNLNDIQDELINNALLKDTGGEIDGNVQINRADGTTSTVGTSTLRVGNDTPTGTDGNSKGRVIIYGEANKYANLQASDVTGNQTIEMPNASGTIALTTNPTDITVDKADGTSSTQGWSSVSIGNNKATGTAGNSAGDLQIYGRTAYKTEFISPPSSPTANRVITIPDASGTMAVEQASSSWSPQIYDYETFKATVANGGGYVRYGRIAIYYMNFRLDSTTTISTMFQIRGFPTGAWVLGGTIYCAGVASSFGDRTIQTAQNAVYVRPNWTGTIAANAWWTGCFIVLLPV